MRCSISLIRDSLMKVWYFSVVLWSSELIKTFESSQNEVPWGCHVLSCFINPKEIPLFNSPNVWVLGFYFSLLQKKNGLKLQKVALCCHTFCLFLAFVINSVSLRTLLLFLLHYLQTTSLLTPGKKIVQSLSRHMDSSHIETHSTAGSPSLQSDRAISQTGGSCSHGLIPLYSTDTRRDKQFGLPPTVTALGAAGGGQRGVSLYVCVAERRNEGSLLQSVKKTHSAKNNYGESKIDAWWCIFRAVCSMNVKRGLLSTSGTYFHCIFAYRQPLFCPFPVRGVQMQACLASSESQQTG